MCMQSLKFCVSAVAEPSLGSTAEQEKDSNLPGSHNVINGAGELQVLRVSGTVYKINAHYFYYVYMGLLFNLGKIAKMIDW